MGISRLMVCTLAVLSAAACSKGGGSGGTTAPPAGVNISGTVSAPGGAIAFNAPTGIKHLWAQLFGGNAMAAISGTLPVGGGVTVNLIEIDANGAQVGATIATGTTDAGGAFTLEAPAGFVPAANYVVRAVGTTGTLDAIVTGTTLEVDPSTEATKQLVLESGAPLSSVSTTQVDVIQSQVQVLTEQTDTSGLTTASAFTTAIKTETLNDEEAGNIVASIAETGVIRGRVTNGAGTTGLANVKVVARDFKDWVTRAETRTDANGDYTLNVPPSRDYIVGALNFTLSPAASAWWTSACDSATCNAANQFNAAKVSVGAAAVIRNFKLPAGARLVGTVKDSNGNPLGGVAVKVRDFTNDQPVGAVHSKADGSYRINVMPGTYTLGTVNSTLQPFAGTFYDGPATGGTASGTGTNASLATPIVLAADDAFTYDFALQPGRRIGGCVTDAPAPSSYTATNPCANSGTPATGVSVRFYSNEMATGAPNGNGAFVEALRANKIGGYRIWLAPGRYTVRARGQTANVDLTSTGERRDFSANVGAVTATLVDGGAVPVSQAKVSVYDSTGANYLGFEISDSDGTVTLYSEATANRLVEIKLDNRQPIGSSIYADQTQLTAGTLVPFTVGSQGAIDGGGTPFPSVTLPAGGVLSGTITAQSGGGPIANAIVQVRSGGTTGLFRFVSTRTQKDGSYSVSLPAGTYNRVCAYIPGTANACNAAASGTGFNSQDSVVISAGGGTTVNLAIP